MEYPFKDLMPLDEVLEREGYYKDWTHLDPEVFYSLTQISEYIKTKGYGVDVRLLIAQLAEHFGLKTAQIVDLGNLLQAEHTSLKQQVQQAVAQVNADRNALETRFNQSVAQMEADKNAVIANATVDSEVILARGGKPTLQARLDEISRITSILDTVVQVNDTIANVFPNVTLSQVKALNSEATLNDSADWYTIQTYINHCAVNLVKRIRIPEGTYFLSRGIDMSKLEYASFVNAEGVIFKAISKMNYMIRMKHNVDYWKARRLNISGLEIRGDYLVTNGVLVDGVQEWSLQTVRIHECFVGLSLIDTYYGEVSSSPIIQDCLVGIDFGLGNTGEVNTVGFYNVKINFATPKTKFYPMLVGESVEQYNERVKSVAVQVGVVMGGISFDGLTAEGMDVVYYYKARIPGNLSNGGIFSIRSCYFEVIRERVFDFSEAELSGFHQTNYTIQMENTRILKSATQKPSILSSGHYVFLGNQGLEVKFISGIRGTLTSGIIDGAVKVTPDSDFPRMALRVINIPKNSNALKYNSYSNDSPYPTQTNVLPSIQDVNTVLHLSRLRPSFTTENPIVLGVHTKPLTFVSQIHQTGPVIQAESGGYYMITTKDGTSIELKEVKNMSYLEPPTNSMTAKEIYRTPNKKEGDKFFCIELDSYVTFANNKLNKSTVIGIGLGSDFATAIPTNPDSWGALGVWNLQINAGYIWEGNYWSWGYSALGLKRSQIRAVGTISQRPTSPSIDGLIYYATDEDKYYKWDSSKSMYNLYTPLL